jgi:chemotaxis protein CheX
METSATAVRESANMTTAIVNPVIAATRSVFEMMLGCTPTRTGLMLKSENGPNFEVSSVIGITGRANGTIVFRVSEVVAVKILSALTGDSADSLNSEVLDAVGELTNMIAGGAKAQLAHLQLSIGIPNVVSGASHSIHYPNNVQPFCIQFDSELGPFMIEVGFSSP